MNYLHRAWAEIDLDALVHNFKLIRKHTNAKIFSVVKANAYGHSISMIARLLDENGTDFFAVSNIDEAKELRELGIEKPILVAHRDTVMENLYAWHREEIEYKDARNREVATA